VTVADTGRGIAEEDQKRLFQPFSQGRSQTQAVSGAKGTGLGLYIVKSIIEQHGGTIGVKSAPGRGTRVSFSLKVAA
jgi:signal transduction histidine kinase